MAAATVHQSASGASYSPLSFLHLSRILLLPACLPGKFTTTSSSSSSNLVTRPWIFKPTAYAGMQRVHGSLHYSRSRLCDVWAPGKLREISQTWNSSVGSVPWETDTLLFTSCASYSLFPLAALAENRSSHWKLEAWLHCQFTLSFQYVNKQTLVETVCEAVWKVSDLLYW